MKADLKTAVFLAGYPMPVAEYKFHPARGWLFDLAWPTLKVAFEREGGTWRGKSRHTTAKGYRGDAIKYNEAAILGWLVIRGTVDMLRDGTALEQLLKALESRRGSAA